LQRHRKAFKNCFTRLINALARTSGFERQNPKVKETLVLESPRAILGSLDILVDIGVPAEKEVIL